MAEATTPAATLTQADLNAMAQQVSNWGRWGAEDERGALNLITQAKRAAAASLVREGATVSCSHPLAVMPDVDNPEPVLHHMLVAGDVPEGAVLPGLTFTADYMAIAPHGLANTHLDALCHFIVDGKMYNGFDASEVTSTGANRNNIMACEGGILSRGVLLDIPGLRGVDWLELGETVARSELEAAEKHQGVQVEEGDILVVSVGRDARRAAKGPWGFQDGMAGLGADCLPWLHERGVAALGSDGFSDAVPAPIEGWASPVHQIGIVYIGLHLIDNMRLDRLLDACRQRKRWDFLLMLGPLPLPGGTGSPVNPIAMF